MKNLLFISIAFPPKNDPECLQTARYFYYLKQLGKFNITVVTAKRPTLHMPEDSSLNRYIQDIDNLIEIPIFERKWINFGLRKLGLDYLLSPDSKMLFHWQWKKAIKKITAKPDFIYSRSNPVSSAFMAMKLKSVYQCPWVMHLSDPWAISPLTKLSRKQRRSKRLEEKLLLNADKVTFTTYQTKELYVKEYLWASQKYHVLPNVYDSKDIIFGNLPIGVKLRVVYTGGLGGERGVFFLKEVFDLARIKIPDINERIEFVFAGDIDRFNKSFIKKNLPWVKHIGIINYSRAKELCQSAHLLLVVDNLTEGSKAVFFPSKLLDYFLSKRKIWAVTPTKSHTRLVLENYNHSAFEHKDVPGMVQFLIEQIHKLESGDINSFTSESIPSLYDAEPNAEKLAQLILSTS